MRKSLIAATALAALAAASTAVAAGGTHPAAQRVRIEVKGTDPYSFELKPTSRGGVQFDFGNASFCCWRTWSVTRGGARLDVSNPLLTLFGERRALKIRERIDWVALPDGWSVCTGTWKVVGGSGAYDNLSGQGRVACVWGPEADKKVHLRIRLFGFLAAK